MTIQGVILKNTILSLSILFLVGCEYVPNTRSTKPYGLSKIKNNARQYESYTQAPKHLSPFLEDDKAGSEKAVEEAVKAVDPQKLSAVRKAYGIPSSEGVRVEDRDALLQLYRIEASRLKELLK